MSEIVVRVYGLFVNDKNEVLLSDEYQLDMYMTKFPGGGLEFGEGTHDCLIRETKEEMNAEIEIVSHFYTTDFYQKGFFRENTQIISVYYLAKFIDDSSITLSQKPFDFPNPPYNGMQSFRYMSIKDLELSEISFPIDKHVLSLLKRMI